MNTLPALRKLAEDQYTQKDETFGWKIIVGVRWITQGGT